MSPDRGIALVGNWHFAEPFTCGLCGRAHTVDEAIALNAARPKKGARPAWGYYAPPCAEEES